MSLQNILQKPLVLASQSPRRSEILKLADIDFTVVPSNYVEDNERQIPPAELVTYHARKKAGEVADRIKNVWVIGADTLVVKDNIVLGKPNDRADAVKMLKTLSGVVHSVYTGFTLINVDNGKFLAGSEKTDVSFRELDDAEIEYYVDQYHPFDKAGAYAIQDYSAVFVQRISGCFYNVVGFPLTAFICLVKSRVRDLL